MSNNNSRKGFASMNRERVRQIASMGGKAAHVAGTAHQYTSEEAREAGRKGGKASHAKGTGYKFDSETGKYAVSKRDGK